MYFLGTITGSSGICYNRQTGVSGLGTFEVPAGVKSVWLQPSMSGMCAQFSTATGITNFAAAGTAGQIGYPGVQGPFRVVPGAQCQIAIYSPLPGSAALFTSMRVFWSPTS